MRERPILFSAPMVRAILAGQKTQTRRVVKPQPPANTYTVSEFHHPDPRPHFWAWTDSPNRPDIANLSDWSQPCPYGQEGDRLWVRETWNQFDGWAGYYYTADYDGWGIGSDDDPDHVPDHAVRWKPSIHMPRAASRITLEITGVRVERLQAISEADALAEGIVKLHDGGYGLPAGEHYHCADPRQSYFSLWETINGPGSVEANPWVWGVEFERLEAAHG